MKIEELYRICTPCARYLGGKAKIHLMWYNMAVCDYCFATVATTKTNNWDFPKDEENEKVSISNDDR